MIPLKKILLSMFILLILAVYIVNAGEFNLDNYRPGWTYENHIWQVSIFYSRPDDREALIRFRLKEGVEQHRVTYSLSSGSREAPEVLLQGTDVLQSFRKINIDLTHQRRERVLVVRFVEDLSYTSSYYPVILRPDRDPGINPVINLEIFHPELAEIIIHKKNIHFNIDSGPGRYREEAFTVEVRTNYEDWSLKAYMGSLSPVQAGVQKVPAIPVEKFLISVDGSEAVPFRNEGINICTGNRNKRESFLIHLFMDASLSLKAGEYTGAELVFALE